MSAKSARYEEVFAYARKLAAEADRLGIEHGIAEKAPQNALSMLESQLRATITKLARLTGIDEQSGGWLDLVRHYGAGSFDRSYYRW